MTTPPQALVVDDEPGIATTASMMLKGDGWVVDSAGSGERALELLAVSSYDLLLLDLMLPGIQGVDVLKRLTLEPKPPRVVVMTAYGSPDRAIEVMRLGAADILRKPFTPEALREVIASVMARETDPAVNRREYSEALDAARSRLRAQRIPAASEWAERAVALCPDRPEGYHLLGACNDFLGKQAEAKTMYGLALEADPGYLPSKRNLDRLVFFHGTRGSVELE
jgi:DNA-binding response OmpR family regulator